MKWPAPRGDDAASAGPALAELDSEPQARGSTDPKPRSSPMLRHRASLCVLASAVALSLVAAGCGEAVGGSSRSSGAVEADQDCSGDACDDADASADAGDDAGSDDDTG